MLVAIPDDLLDIRSVEAMGEEQQRSLADRRDQTCRQRLGDARGQVIEVPARGREGIGDAGRESYAAVQLRNDRQFVPSLHVEYKKSKVKQYHKEGQALRTETTINNTYDFTIGRALRNLPALREIGFAANRRLLHVESLSHDCLIGEDALDAVSHPVVVQDQRAAGLRFGDGRVHALMHALCLFALAPTGFRHRELRGHVAQLRAPALDTYSTGSMTYDLRRVRLHGLIERVPRSHRYRVTVPGAQVAMFYARLYTRALRPANSLRPSGSARAQHAFERLDAALATFLQEVKLAA